ncbi:DUF3592 domain-containing protein [Streptomyces sp. NPDC047525]|uniref:DUF3592 domain-containing protein n=1 Tax=Streptomyces sp. NPDC047525 TaxID=3155264 RepID=UPI0034020DDF
MGGPRAAGARGLEGGGSGRTGGVHRSGRPTLQFETGDGQVVEVVSPVPQSRRAPLAAGDRVRIAYDSDDPRETVMLGRERRGIDRGFVAAGAAVLVLGLVLTALAL